MTGEWQLVTTDRAQCALCHRWVVGKVWRYFEKLVAKLTVCPACAEEVD